MSGLVQGREYAYVDAADHIHRNVFFAEHIGPTILWPDKAVSYVVTHLPPQCSLDGLYYLEINFGEGQRFPSHAFIDHSSRGELAGLEGTYNGGHWISAWYDIKGELVNIDVFSTKPLSWETSIVRKAVLQVVKHPLGAK